MRQRVKYTLQKGSMESLSTSSPPCPPVSMPIPRANTVWSSPSMCHMLQGGTVAGDEAQAKKQGPEKCSKECKSCAPEICPLPFCYSFLPYNPPLPSPAHLDASLCFSESFLTESPSRRTLQLKKISPSASILDPDATAAREEATGNLSYPCSVCIFSP